MQLLNPSRLTRDWQASSNPEATRPWDSDRDQYNGNKGSPSQARNRLRMGATGYSEYRAGLSLAPSDAPTEP